MKRLHRIAIVLAAIIFPSTLLADSAEREERTVYPTAILDFSERGKASEDLGTQVSELLFVNLVARTELVLVDRKDFQKALSEQELGLSGMVKPDEAATVGRLTGAKLLITGSILDVGESRYLVAKIIGTETSRALGASVKGKKGDQIDTLVEALADKVADTIAKRGAEIVPKPLQTKDYAAAIRQKVGKAAQPLLSIRISESHVGQMIVDPAAETELTLLANQTGFPVVDPKESNAPRPAIKITGEAFSQFATRRGDLTAVKARLEVKAVDVETGKVLCADRQVAIAVDLAEQIAAKTALQQAAAELAERLLPKLARGGEKKAE